MFIKIYEQEIQDGLEEAIASNSTIAYCSEILNFTDTISISDLGGDEAKAKADNLFESAAQNNDQIDLYYLSSVLVSSGWNKNDDVFDSQEMWQARSTPEDKQFNFMHNEKDIIGHITGNYVVDFEGNRLDSKADWIEAGSPKDFNIITNAVLYTSWSDQDLRGRMAKIVQEIEEGDKWFVSMECMFPNFDYALQNSQGETKVVRREEASAFLTKHLRAYGGTGKYEDYTVGRLLRNISFSGKGLVSKPANPRSVILRNESNLTETESKLVTISSQKENEMSDVLQKQVDELKVELSEARATNETMKQEMEEKKAEAMKLQLESFEATISDKDEAIASLETQFNETSAKVKELEEALAAVEVAKEEAVAQIEEIKKAAALEKRTLALTEAGLEDEELNDAIAKFESLDDETFDFVVAKMGKKYGEKEEEEEDKKEAKADPKKKGELKMKGEKKIASEASEEEIDEAEASEEILEEAEEVADVAMAEAIDESEESEDLRSTASEWFGSFLKSTANLND